MNGGRSCFYTNKRQMHCSNSDRSTYKETSNKGKLTKIKHKTKHGNAHAKPAISLQFVLKSWTNTKFTQYMVNAGTSIKPQQPKEQYKYQLIYSDRKESWLPFGLSLSFFPPPIILVFTFGPSSCHLDSYFVLIPSFILTLDLVVDLDSYFVLPFSSFLTYYFLPPPFHFNLGTW